MGVNTYLLLHGQSWHMTTDKHWRTKYILIAWMGKAQKKGETEQIIGKVCGQGERRSDTQTFHHEREEHEQKAPCRGPTMLIPADLTFWTSAATCNLCSPVELSILGILTSTSCFLSLTNPGNSFWFNLKQVTPCLDVINLPILKAIRNLHYRSSAAGNFKQQYHLRS